MDNDIDSYEGRLDRKGYILNQLGLLAGGVVIGFLSVSMFNSGDFSLRFLPVIYVVFWFIRIIYTSIKRFHDIGKSGWFSILLFIPYLNILVYIYLMFAPSQEYTNQWGEYTPKELDIDSLQKEIERMDNED